MRKIVFVLLSIMLTLTVVLTACKGNQQKKNYNVLGGRGDLHNVKDKFCRGEVYDDDYIYFLVRLNSILPGSTLAGAPYSYVKMDKKGKIAPNCNVPTCVHLDCENCEARAYFHYFVFAGHLYKYEFMSMEK